MALITLLGMLTFLYISTLPQTSAPLELHLGDLLWMLAALFILIQLMRILVCKAGRRKDRD